MFYFGSSETSWPFFLNFTIIMKYKRLAITEKVAAIVQKLKKEYSKLIFHQNGGYCYIGTAPNDF